MNQVATDLHPVFKRYIPMAESIAKTFGSHCEVVIHDLTDVSASIVAIFNGHVTGRQVGSTITSFGLNLLRKVEEGTDCLLNYVNEDLRGKRVKSSSIYIRDDDGNLLGCLSINLDITQFSIVEKLLAEITDTKKDEESAPLSISQFENQMIERAAEKIGKPIQMMDKADRIPFIYLLDDMGLFRVKGSIQHVASLLGVSKFTIYNYLDKKT
ncbi:helix-turn-helix transcriptional regulator [Pseudalkalibacillus salsuginis]|uniref:helix-turn-helix transcriptional regulator n=1 Tax=Pseudalkalibacillus salsuginis TaxID=2910972 RepID=UPI001F306DC4|nr:PAS domain-containing protein [Pseudalkalibacillus salsuginis]MCF6411383.1 helix-turn-helix transcriptional regulator [Pseudalkalibacillus salsuginis]